MEISSRISGDVQVLRVEAARIDAAAAIRFKDEVRAAAKEGGARVVLDLDAVEFVDSSGLGAIVAAMKALPEGRKLDLAGLHGAVAQVFRLTRMDQVFAIHDSAEAALASADG